MIFIKKFIKFITILFILAFIIIEEYFWNLIFKKIYLHIKKLNFLLKFKSFIKNINNRFLVLFIFIIPFILMELFGILAGKALLNGLLFTAIYLYSIKISLTIPVVIIFNSQKENLLSFKIIYLFYFWIVLFKRSKIYREIKERIKRIKRMYMPKKSFFKSIFKKYYSYFKKKITKI
jgi:hypothetical protein